MPTFPKHLAVWLLAAALAALPAIPLPARATAQLRNEEVLQALQLPEDPDTFSFAVVGDSRNNLPVLARLLQQIEADAPLFVVYTGDLVGEATAGRFQEALAVLHRFPLPIFMVMGNHDRAREGPYRFYDAFGAAEYSFDVGNNRFIALDNSQGLLTGAQLKWLEPLLATEKRKFVFAHESPAYGPHNRGVFYPNAPGFMALAERYHVAYCVFGHMHLFDHYQRNGTHYVISGGGGAPLYKFLPLIARDGGYFFHYLLFTVTPQGVSMKVVKLEPQPKKALR